MKNILFTSSMLFAATFNSFAVTIPLAMKLDEKTIFNVLLALMAFEVLNRLFLADFIDGIVPAKKTGGFERTV